MQNGRGVSPWSLSRRSPWIWACSMRLSSSTQSAAKALAWGVTRPDERTCAVLSSAPGYGSPRCFTTGLEVPAQRGLDQPLDQPADVVVGSAGCCGTEGGQQDRKHRDVLAHVAPPEAGRGLLGVDDGVGDLLLEGLVGQVAALG